MMNMYEYIKVYTVEIVIPEFYSKWLPFEVTTDFSLLQHLLLWHAAGSELFLAMLDPRKALDPLLCNELLNKLLPQISTI